MPEIAKSESGTCLPKFITAAENGVQSKFFPAQEKAVAAGKEEIARGKEKREQIRAALALLSDDLTETKEKLQACQTE